MNSRRVRAHVYDRRRRVYVRNAALPSGADRGGAATGGTPVSPPPDTTAQPERSAERAGTSAPAVATRHPDDADRMPVDPRSVTP